MSSTSFDNYKSIAEQLAIDDIAVSGRYAFQAAAERRIITDVAQKLKLDSQDTLLEIGCGPGNILIPLSFLVSKSAGIDNVSALTRLRSRCGSSTKIDTYPGDFLAMQLPSEYFSKILIYSVLQYVESQSVAIEFVRRAMSLLQPGGLLLLGDLPNQDKKRRFMSSGGGESASKAWQEQVSKAGVHPLSSLPQDERMLVVDDELVFSVLKFCRAFGCEAYLQPQPPDLPFGNSREDILVVAPK